MKIPCTLLLSIFLVGFLGVCQSLSLHETLSLPISSTSKLQAGAIDCSGNKGYSVISSNTGSLLLRFTLNPFGFSAFDYVFIPVSIVHANGAIVDSTNQRLYVYGYNAGIGGYFGSVAGIESFDISNGTSFQSLAAYFTLAEGARGFRSAFARPSIGHVFTIKQESEKTTLYELDLLKEGPAEVVHQSSLLSPEQGANFTYTQAVLWEISSNSQGKDIASQTYYAFGTEGSVLSPESKVSGKEFPEYHGNFYNAEYRPQTSKFSPTFGPPTFASYYSAFPWLIDKTSQMTGNFSLSGMTSCKQNALLVALVASCSVTGNTCSSFSVVPLTSTLDSSTKISLGTFDVGTNTTKTISCVPDQDVVLVTIGNTALRVDLVSQQVDKLTSPKYENFVWCNADSTGTYAYIGATANSPSGSTSAILQVTL